MSGVRSNARKRHANPYSTPAAKRKLTYTPVPAFKPQYGPITQAQSIRSIASKTAALARRTRGLQHWCQYKLNQPQKIVPDDFLVMRPLIDPEHWGKLFQATTDTDSSNKYQIKSLTLKTQFTYAQISAGGHDNVPPIHVDMFIVSLRETTGEAFNTKYNNLFTTITDTQGSIDYKYKEARIPYQDSTTQAESYWQRTTLNQIVMQAPGQTQAVPFQYAMINLNKGIFKIHKHRSFMIGNCLNNAPSLVAYDNPLHDHDSQGSSNHNSPDHDGEGTVDPDDPNFDAPPTAYPIKSSQLIDFTKTFNDVLTQNKTIKAGTSKWKSMAWDDVATKDQLYLVVHYSKPAGLLGNLAVSGCALANGVVSN